MTDQGQMGRSCTPRVSSVLVESVKENVSLESMRNGAGSQNERRFKCVSEPVASGKASPGLEFSRMASP